MEIESLSSPAAKYFDVAEIADRLGVCQRTVRRWIAAGTLKSNRLGSRLIRVSEADLAAFIAGGSDGG